MLKTKIYQETNTEWDRWYRNLDVKDILPLAYTERHLEEFQIYSRYLKKNSRFLEAGCGLGNQLVFLKERGFQVIGIDYAQTPLKKFKAYDASTCVLAADIHQMPFCSGSFYAYLSFGVLEHLDKGPGRALRDANRILEQEGIIVVSIPSNYFLAKIASGQIETLLSRVKRNRLIRRIFNLRERKKPIFAINYSKGQLKIFLEEAGFKILTIKPTGHDFIWYTFCPFFRKNKMGVVKPAGVKFSRIVRKFFPWRTSFYIFAVATKVRDI